MLQSWKRVVFLEYKSVINLAEDEVLKNELVFETVPSEYNKKNLCAAQQLLSTKLDLEEIFWKQKDNIKWLKKGDRNIAFFHRTVKKRDNN